MHDPNHPGDSQDASGSVRDLRSRWHDLLLALGKTGPEVDRLGEDLLVRWCESHRHYHSATHLRHLLDLLPTGEPTLLLAAWFHDAVYDPRSPHNEQASAGLARTGLSGLRLSASLIEEVARLILLTRSHQTAPDDTTGRLFLDADLAILGEPARVYADYAQAIRREYAWVSEADYRAGRQKVLQQFLERDFIYGTPLYQAEREAPARANLRWELAELSGD